MHDTTSSSVTTLTADEQLLREQTAEILAMIPQFLAEGLISAELILAALKDKGKYGEWIKRYGSLLRKVQDQAVTDLMKEANDKVAKNKKAKDLEFAKIVTDFLAKAEKEKGATRFEDKPQPEKEKAAELTAAQKKEVGARAGNLLIGLKTWTKAFQTAFKNLFGIAEAKVEKATGPTLITLECLSDLMHHYERLGVASLIVSDLENIDPVIGDASCQTRTAFLLDMHRLVQQVILAKKADALKCALEFKKSAEKLNDGSVRNKSQIVPAASSAFQAFFTDVCKNMEQTFKGATEYLGLCVCLSRTNTWRYDLFATPFHFRDKGEWFRIADEKSLVTYNNQKCHDQKLNLKVKLGQLSSAYIRHVAKRVASPTPTSDSPTTANTSSSSSSASSSDAHKSVELMLYDTLNKCEAQKTLDHEEGIGDDRVFRIEIQPIYATFRVIVMNEWCAGAPINVIVRRIRMKGARENRTYVLDDARVLQWTPNLSKYQHNSVILRPNLPCFTVDAFSIFTEDGQVPDHLENGGKGAEQLFSNNSDTYFNFLKTCDLPTMIQIYAAGHPPFAQTGYVAPEADPRAYQSRLHTDGVGGDRAQNQLVAFTRTGSSGQLLPCTGITSAATDISQELIQCYKVATDWHLLHGQQVTKDGNFVTRMSHAMCFAPEHVKVMSFEQAQKWCADVKARKADNYDMSNKERFELDLEKKKQQ